MQLQIGSLVELVGLVIVHLAEQVLALFDDDVASGAGAIASAGVIQIKTEVKRHIQDRSRLTMILIRKRVEIEFDCAILG